MQQYRLFEVRPAELVATLEPMGHGRDRYGEGLSCALGYLYRSDRY